MLTFTSSPYPSLSTHSFIHYYDRTREEIVALVYTLVRAANDIYGDTKFHGTAGVRFAVKRISVRKNWKS